MCCNYKRHVVYTVMRDVVFKEKNMHTGLYIVILLILATGGILTFLLLNVYDGTIEEAAEGDTFDAPQQNIQTGWIHDLCYQHDPIALVGNGPLSVKYRERLSHYKTVVAFNRARHTLRNVTHLCVRHCKDVWSGKDKGVCALPPDHEQINRLSGIVYFGPTTSTAYTQLPREFPDPQVHTCTLESGAHIQKFVLSPSVQTRVMKCPSTGLLGVRYFLQNYPNAEIHVYGMSGHLQPLYHNGDLEQKLMRAEDRITLFHK